MAIEVQEAQQGRSRRVGRRVLQIGEHHQEQAIRAQAAAVRH